MQAMLLEILSLDRFKRDCFNAIYTNRILSDKGGSYQEEGAFNPQSLYMCIWRSRDSMPY